MNKLLFFPYATVRLWRRSRIILKIISLRLRGVSVHSSAIISPTAFLEPSGGEIKIGARTYIDHGVIIRSLGGRIEIGDDCSINAYSVLYGAGGLEIGKGVRIASHTVIVPSNHRFSDPNTPIKDQGLTLKGIFIEDDVWIGAGARILDGVRISSGSVVGAGAVVTKSTEPYSIVAGVPATKINIRKG